MCPVPGGDAGFACRSGHDAMDCGHAGPPGTPRTLQELPRRSIIGPVADLVTSGGAKYPRHRQQGRGSGETLCFVAGVCCTPSGTTASQVVRSCDLHALLRASPVARRPSLVSRRWSWPRTEATKMPPQLSLSKIRSTKPGLPSQPCKLLSQSSHQVRCDALPSVCLSACPVLSCPVLPVRVGLSPLTDPVTAHPHCLGGGGEGR